MKIKTVIKWTTILSIVLFSGTMIILDKYSNNNDNIKDQPKYSNQVEEKRWWKCYGEMSIFYRETGQHFSDRPTTIRLKNSYCSKYAKDETVHYPGKRENNTSSD